MKIYKPDFKKSIINVSATLSNFLGNKTDIKTLKVLEKELLKDYKNVVYICCDGLGVHPLKVNLDKHSFLRKNIRKKITSVFPSTTTNATSTLMSASYPSQHGMFGWSLYIEKLKRCVDIYMNTDSYTGEHVEHSSFADDFAFDNYFDNAITTSTISTVFPPYIKREKNNYCYTNLNEMFAGLKECCKKPGKQFVYCYCNEPDHTMHEFGVTSAEANAVINAINSGMEELNKEFPDTLFIITPDHGHVDINEYIELYKDKDLLNTLEYPLYLEVRAVAFKIKNGMEAEFLALMKKYKKDLKLLKVEKLIKKNYFGDKTEKLKLLGDYIAVVKDINKQCVFKEDGTRFKGHHTGLSKEEMILPLIVFGNKK